MPHQNTTNNNIIRKSWTDFYGTGLLLIINQLLHVFGWSIAFTFNDDGTVKDAFPARVKYRGFPDKAMDRSYTAVTKYMHEHSKELLDEITEDEE